MGFTGKLNHPGNLSGAFFALEGLRLRIELSGVNLMLYKDKTPKLYQLGGRRASGLGINPR